MHSLVAQEHLPLAYLKRRRAISPQADAEALRPQVVGEGEPRGVLLLLQSCLGIAPLFAHNKLFRLHGLARHEIAHLDLRLPEALKDRVEQRGHRLQVGCV